jgi:hypothetical protein
MKEKTFFILAIDAFCAFWPVQDLAICCLIYVHSASKQQNAAIVRNVVCHAQLLWHKNLSDNGLQIVYHNSASTKAELSKLLQTRTAEVQKILSNT